MCKKVLSALFVLGIFLAAGCGSSYNTVAVHPAQINMKQRTVAVLPLANLTSHPNAGRIVGDILSTELYATGRFQLIERTDMLAKLVPENEDPETTMDMAVARSMGAKLGVDSVVYGSVSEFRYKRGIDQSPAVGINLRMLDVETGMVLWAASRSQSGGCFFNCDEALNVTTQRVLGKMVDDLDDTLDSVKPAPVAAQ